MLLLIVRGAYHLALSVPANLAVEPVGQGYEYLRFLVQPTSKWIST